MKATDAVVSLEFNELTPHLMQRFMEAGQLPNFNRLYQTSHVYTTDADEPGVILDPWVQWVTYHSGVPAAEHGIRRLGEAANFKEPRIWDVVSAAGRNVWVCGSMNAYYKEPFNGCVLPDPWSDDSIEPQPAELEPFYRFVRQNVQEHSREDAPYTRRDAVRFVRFMLGHGLSARSVTSLAAQLLRERGGRFRWKRATLLDKLQWDVFVHYYRRVKPPLSTFFLNSTAHFQHRFWRNMEPEAFKIQPEAGQQAEYSGAILYGYQEMDRLLGRVFRLVGDRATIVFSTALSQQPHLGHEASGGKHCYRPRDAKALLAALGVDVPVRFEPVMAEQFYLHFTSQPDLERAEARLNDLYCEGERVFNMHRADGALFGGCRIRRRLPEGVALSSPQHDRPLSFFDHLYLVEAVKSGRHHPDGMLWIRTPDRQHAVHNAKVSLCHVAPTVLGLLGIDPPPSMRFEPLALGSTDNQAARREAEVAVPQVH